jgi:glycosyltransferase involved in cell wall biosynthesis
MIKVSIIVPVYNVEPYLRRCLDSLVNQTLRDIEIICINDCSPDKSLIILKEYAKNDKRIKIIDFERNQGVSMARNSGMKIAKGEYIGFCDPDDYVDLDFYEKLYMLAKNKNADIAKAACKEIDSNSEKKHEKIRKHKCYFYSHFWTAIYRNEMLKKNRVKFPVGKSNAQDLCFLNHAVIVANSIYVLDNIFYHYVRNENSSDSKILNSKKANSVCSCICLLLNRLNRIIEQDIHYFPIYKFFFYHIFYLLSRNSDKEFLKKVVKIVIKYFYVCKFPKKLNSSKILGKSIFAALNDKNEKKLFLLLQELQNNEFYPKISIKELSLRNRKLYVWGAGADGSKVLLQCKRNNWKIEAFLDSNKKSKKINNYSVKTPQSILNKSKKDFFIIISSRKYAIEIAKICKEAGLKIGKDFWKPN